jgi:hypothetical protein
MLASHVRWCLVIGESDSQYRCTALMRAAADGHADCVRLLIDAGADKEARDEVCVIRCIAVAPSFLFLWSLFLHSPL